MGNWIESLQARLIVVNCLKPPKDALKNVSKQHDNLKVEFSSTVWRATLLQILNTPAYKL